MDVNYNSAQAVFDPGPNYPRRNCPAIPVYDINGGSGGNTQLASSSENGLMSSADFNKLSFLTATGAIDLDSLSANALRNVVEDTTPQLGGNLDPNGNYIDGNLGIGTSPTARLHISGDNSTIVAVEGTGAANTVVKWFDDGTERGAIYSLNGNSLFHIRSQQGFKFVTGGSVTAMLLDASGNVGIGTLSPNEKLHVGGSIKANEFHGADALVMNFYENRGTGIDGIAFHTDNGSSTYLRRFLLRRGGVDTLARFENASELSVDTGGGAGNIFKATAQGVSIGNDTIDSNFKLDVHGRTYIRGGGYFTYGLNDVSGRSNGIQIAPYMEIGVTENGRYPYIGINAELGIDGTGNTLSFKPGYADASTTRTMGVLFAGAATGTLAYRYYNYAASDYTPVDFGSFKRLFTLDTVNENVVIGNLASTTSSKLYVKADSGVSGLYIDWRDFTTTNSRGIDLRVNSDLANASNTYGFLLYTSFAHTTTRALMKIENDNAASLSVALDVKQDGSSNAIQASNSGGGNALKTTGKVQMNSLPTSATGLSAGDLWNDAGTIKIA